MSTSTSASDSTSTKGWFLALLTTIGGFFANLFKHTEDDFNELPQAQQDALIQGVGIAQILKDTAGQGEADVVSAIATKLNVSPDVAAGALIAVGKDIGIDTGSINDVLNALADKAQTTITDNGWNALWQDVAQFAATFMATGQLNWVTLSLGVIEFAYQKFIKNVE